MIVKGYIEATLQELEKLYNQHQSIKKDIYYSKLAILELCGWIEESFDHIAKVSVFQQIKSNTFRKILKETIKRNYGFLYADHFRPMFIKVIGIVKAEKIERKIDMYGDVQVLSSNLASLKEIRDSNAHTFLRGTTTTIQSPSITISQFQRIFPIIKKFESEVKK